MSQYEFYSCININIYPSTNIKQSYLFECEQKWSRGILYNQMSPANMTLLGDDEINIKCTEVVL